MGSTQSKEKRHAAISSTPSSPILSTSLSSSSRKREPEEITVTRPSPPRRITTMSTLIDPADLIANAGWSIKSPSGNILGPEGYRNHPYRPLSIPERQQRIVEGMQRHMEKVEAREAAIAVAKAEALLAEDAKPKGLARLLCY